MVGTHVVDDECACGHCTIQIVDSDGDARRRRGARITRPWHFSVADPGLVKFESWLSPDDPVHFLQLENDPAQFLTACWWLGIEKGQSNILCVLELGSHLPFADLDENEGSIEFVAHATVPFAAGNSNAVVRISLQKQRFEQLRVTKINVEMPAHTWTSFKEIQARFRQSERNWPKIDQKGSQAFAAADGNVFAASGPVLDSNDRAESTYDASGPTPPPCSIL
eukprot:TRINITY_DN23589_c0_g1_i1.p1 TRINITY_DN23589_c0_g1~~TRINITY_DN23589_c0_g1_i1.p1  ORF type:complete len:239 (+),score=21.18 TRINITY_DN23589_c0_g1_i1:51-719(+)